MHFNSAVFVVFFICFTIGFYSVKKEHQKYLMLAGNLIFFASFNLLSLIAVIYISIIVYFCINLLSINTFKSPVRRGTLLCFCITIVMPLLVTKFLFPNAPFINTDVVKSDYYSMYLHPVGISFYSLQVIGLVVDAYKGQLSRRPRLFNIVSFASFFPLSLAGPIHRGNDLMPQLERPSGFDALNILSGVRILIWGFICKLLVADKLALLIGPIFTDIGYYSSGAIVVATFLFSIQIYFDLYGYTEIARGLAKILGIEVATNFNSPYLASSFTDFWRRWHISVSSWFRDYIYIPLGGSRNGYWKYIFAVIVTFFLSGIWHGSSVNYIIWGLLHAFFILAERWFAGIKRIERLKGSRIIRLFQVLIFYLLLCFTWLIFKVTDTSLLLATLEKFVSYEHGLIGLGKFLNFNSSVFMFFTAVVIVMNGSGKFKRLLSSNVSSISDYFYNTLYLSTSLILILIFGDLGMQQFLYSNF